VLERKPLFTMLGLLLGLAVAIYGGYRMLVQMVLRGPDSGGKGGGQG